MDRLSRLRSTKDIAPRHQHIGTGSDQLRPGLGIDTAIHLDEEIRGKGAEATDFI